MDLTALTSAVILGGALALAWWVARLAERRGFDITGLEAVVLGILAGPYGREVISEETLTALGPALSFALGALGLGVGLRLHLAAFSDRPQSAVRSTLTLALTTGLLVGAVLFPLLVQMSPHGDAAIAALVLTAAAVLSAPAAVERATADYVATEPTGVGHFVRLIRTVSRYSQAIGVFCFGLVLCFFHVGDGAAFGGRDLVGVEWALIAVSIGAALGFVFALFLGSGQQADQALPVTLVGMVLFASGAAYALNLSPLMVCLVMGAVAVNASQRKEALRNVVMATERPLLMVVLFFAASAWRVPPTWAWLLAAAYLIVRFIGRFLAGRISAGLRTEHPRDLPRLSMALLGQSGLCVAIALNTWQVYPGELAQAVLTCLLVCGFAYELPSAWFVRRALQQVRESAAEPQGEQTDEVTA